MKLLSAALVLIILFFAAYEIFLFFEPLKIDETLIEINKGASAQEIAQKLYRKNIIRSKNWFYIYVKLSGKDKQLSWGKYLFFGNYSLLDVVEKLISGKVVLNKLTIPEGLTIRKTCRLLSRNKFGNYLKFKKLCNDSLYASQLTGFDIPNLEGFLYPETYFFPESASEDYIIRTLVNRFFTQTAELDFNPTLGLDFYETLIVASIVEKEARVESEKPLIASVYLNRIRYGMKLQADPTVAYILEQMGRTRYRIYYRDLKIESPYNTYLNKELPPTPICSPSYTTIKAVLHPQESDYFYFFADKSKGTHIFSKTYSEHLQKQRNLKKKNGK
ncbi:MAG: hypothetical protein PWQ09_1248 [Candidatus Cloacimonadota bacterium]|jgi:UPF0755 protein|nr:hypothetical protein [Candidatus Cloacimonadota bacterium]